MEGYILPAAIADDIPVLSSERAPHINKPQMAIIKLRSLAQMVAWRQDRLAD
jgi:hypothetical protein